MKHRPVEQIDRDDAAIGIDVGKTSFPVVGLNRRGAIVRCQPWPRSKIGARLAAKPPCLIGTQASRVGAQHLSQQLQARCHDARPISLKYQNDFRGAQAIAEAVQDPVMKFVATDRRSARPASADRVRGRRQIGRL